MWWRLYRDQDTMHSSLLASSLTQESNLILLQVCFFFSPLYVSRFIFFIPSIYLSLHAVSRRTPLEVRSESASVCRQPWQPCPNWPMVWQDDCQLLSVRAVHADMQQVWTAPDGSFSYERSREKSLFSRLPVWALKSISWDTCWCQSGVRCSVCVSQVCCLLGN